MQFLDNVVFLPGIVQRLALLVLTVQKFALVPQLQFIDGRRHPCFRAVAVTYGPACSENHRDSAVAVGQVVDAPVVQVVPCPLSFWQVLMVQTLQKTVEVPQFRSSIFVPGRRHLCRGAETVSHGPVRTIEILQLQFTDKVIDVPVVPVQFPSAGVEKTAELPHCSRRALDKVVDMPVCATASARGAVQQGCGRRCVHASTSSRQCREVPQSCSSTRCSSSEEGFFLPHFAAFFALRPAGRECPFFSPRRRRVLRCRGLGVVGTPGVRLPSVLPLQLGATVMGHRQRSLINISSVPQPPPQPPPRPPTEQRSTRLTTTPVCGPRFFLSVSRAVAMSDREPAGEGAARRRRERRLRQWARHEKLSVQMALSEYKHHSSRGQRKDRAGREVRVVPHGGSPGSTSPPGRFPATLSGCAAGATCGDGAAHRGGSR